MTESEDRKTYLKNYYWRNRDKILSRNKKWEKANPEKVAIRCKKYYALNKEKLSENSRNWAKRNPEKVKDIWRKWESSHKENRRNKTLKKYSMVEKDYLKMFEQQKGVCGICGQPELSKRLSVDHCHTTGKVRGLLCDRCNRGIGLFKDNTKYLLSASNYLKNHE